MTRRLAPEARPYTPDTLAARWECSAETIRQMVHRGELPAFQVCPRLAWFSELRSAILRSGFASRSTSRRIKGLVPTHRLDTQRTRQELPTQETAHD